MPSSRAARAPACASADLVILEHKLDVRAAGGLDLRDGKLGAVALDAAVIRAGTGQRQHDAELEMHARAEVLPLETEHLADLIAGDAAGAGRRGVLRHRRLEARAAHSAAPPNQPRSDYCHQAFRSFGHRVDGAFSVPPLPRTGAFCAAIGFDHWRQV